MLRSTRRERRNRCQARRSWWRKFARVVHAQKLEPRSRRLLLRDEGPRIGDAPECCRAGGTFDRSLGRLPVDCGGNLLGNASLVGLAIRLARRARLFFAPDALDSLLRVAELIDLDRNDFVGSSLIFSIVTDLMNLSMKRFAFIASMFALPLLTLAGAFAAQQQIAPKAAASACGCTECRCPDCNGEFCTCEVCECGTCGCTKAKAAPAAPAKAGCCSARQA